MLTSENGINTNIYKHYKLHASQRNYIQGPVTGIANLRCYTPTNLSHTVSFSNLRKNTTYHIDDEIQLQWLKTTMFLVILLYETIFSFNKAILVCISPSLEIWRRNGWVVQFVQVAGENQVPPIRVPNGLANSEERCSKHIILQRSLETYNLVQTQCGSCTWQQIIGIHWNLLMFLWVQWAGWTGSKGLVLPRLQA